MTAALVLLKKLADLTQLVKLYFFVFFSLTGLMSGGVCGSIDMQTDGKGCM